MGQQRQTLIQLLRVQASVNDPFLGATTTAAFEQGSRLWPGDRWSDVRLVHTLTAGQRRLEEYYFVPDDSTVPYLPVAFMFETDDEGQSHVRVHSDHHLVEDRAPILPVREGIHPWSDEDDVLYAYFRALNQNRLDDVLSLFEADGYFRHSNGETFVGRDELRRDFVKMLGANGINLKYCQFTDDGKTCAAEVYMPSGRPAIAVYERGRPGYLHAVRIYM